jgi:hypothetical protein
VPRDTLSARVGGLTLRRPADDPELIEAKRDLALTRLEEHIADVVTTLPPLTAAQRARLTALLVDGAA